MQTAGEPLPSATKRRRWGRGEIDTLFEGQVHNGRTHLHLEHMSGESYAAFLSFARFPDLMSFPDGEPWLHFADSLPFPVEISARMKLIPPAKASKDVSRRLAHARDMDSHIREAGAEAPSPWPSRSPRPECSSTASPRNGCLLSTAGTG
jgi:hypothetical protein